MGPPCSDGMAATSDRPLSTRMTAVALSSIPAAYYLILSNHLKSRRNWRNRERLVWSSHQPRGFLKGWPDLLGTTSGSWQKDSRVLSSTSWAEAALLSSLTTSG